MRRILLLMNLYTVLLAFEDQTNGIDQFEAKSPDLALEEFVLKAKSLDNYDRQSLLSIIRKRSGESKLLIQVADLKGIWILNFGTKLIDVQELSSIFGGYIIQSDFKSPAGKNNL